jgi:hypothetical protein
LLTIFRSRTYQMNGWRRNGEIQNWCQNDLGSNIEFWPFYHVVTTWSKLCLSSRWIMIIMYVMMLNCDNHVFLTSLFLVVVWLINFFLSQHLLSHIRSKNKFSATQPQAETKGVACREKKDVKQKYYVSIARKVTQKQKPGLLYDANVI